MTKLTNDIFFNYHLPEKLIAKYPLKKRCKAKLLFYHDGHYHHHHIGDIPHLLPAKSVIVFNNSRVIPAFLKGTTGHHKTVTANLIATKHSANHHDWQAMIKGSKKIKIGDEINFGNTAQPFIATLIAKQQDGFILLHFHDEKNFWQNLHQYGKMPIPPYLKRPPETSDESDYQTIFAKQDGSIASPTAGLHFTHHLKNILMAQGFLFLPLTLHVGLGTFLPIKTDIKHHKMHHEFGMIDQTTAEQYNLAKREGRKIIALGTTSLRLLESAIDQRGQLQTFQGTTDIFIKPPYKITTADYLLTNFHLPASTLLLLVNSFIGCTATKKLYEIAIEQCYRFYSYGDACLLKNS
ncbi:MAG: tRNA preQ1(34) S-adenosylmethionine ribosyltransferase-isomerase QueA [Alphaproteobacteria bacterium]